MTVTLDIGTGRPKRDIVEMAHQYCGLAIATVSADELTNALRTLNYMMMEPPFNRIGYAVPAYGDGDLAHLSGIEDTYVPAVVLSLAARIAPGMGKTLSVEAKAAMAQAMGVLRAATVQVPAFTPADGLPMGAGARRSGVALGASAWTYTEGT